MNILYLAVGGALGTLSRYYVTGRVSDWSGGMAGLGVFTVNIVGSFIIGLFLTLAEDRYMWPSSLRLFVAVGFLGGFTTFSSFTWETYQMLNTRDFAAATVNVGASIICGMAAVYAGAVLGRAI